MDWREEAACKDLDPELFFPSTGAGEVAELVALAKSVCANCTVRDECLRFAVRSKQEFGIWGGMTEEERRTARVRIPVA